MHIYADVFPPKSERNNKRQKSPLRKFSRDTPPHLKPNKHPLTAMARTRESIADLPDHDWRVLTHRASEGRLPPASFARTERSERETTNSLSNRFSQLIIRHDEDALPAAPDMALQPRLFNVEITDGGLLDSDEDGESLSDTEDEEDDQFTQAFATAFGLHDLERTATAGTAGDQINTQTPTGRRGAIDMTDGAQRIEGMSHQHTCLTSR